MIHDAINQFRMVAMSYKYTISVCNYLAHRNNFYSFIIRFTPEGFIK